jgi:hypothetical protein
MDVSQVNKERVALLVSALRSGEYEQCRSHLRVDNRYCCLGVATEVAIKNGLEGLEADREGYIWEHGGLGTAYEEASMPNPVAEWYGLDGNPELHNPHFQAEAGNYLDYDGSPDPSWEVDTATECNDERAMDFLAIADAFEYTYLTGK